MRDDERWVGLLRSTGAMQSGHFLLSSGRHSGQYIQCAKVLEHPTNASALGKAIAAKWRIGVDRVVAPPLGGILIGYEVARHLGVPLLFPERGPDGAFKLRRGFALQKGERVGVVEDVITTGGTTREILALARESGAMPVGVACIVDRSEAHEIDGTEVRSLVRLQIPTYASGDCPLCRAGVPLMQPGSRHTGEEAPK